MKIWKGNNENIKETIVCFIGFGDSKGLLFFNLLCACLRAQNKMFSNVSETVYNILYIDFFSLCSVFIYQDIATASHVTYLKKSHSFVDSL